MIPTGDNEEMNEKCSFTVEPGDIVASPSDDEALPREPEWANTQPDPVWAYIAPATVVELPNLIISPCTFPVLDIEDVFYCNCGVAIMVFLDVSLLPSSTKINSNGLSRLRDTFKHL